MTIRQLRFMNRNKMIPESLTIGWEVRHNPAEYSFDYVSGACYAITFLLGILGFFAGGAIIYLLFIVSVVLCFPTGWNQSNRDFCRNLVKLRVITNLDWIDFLWRSKRDILRSKIRESLIYRAARTVAAEDGFGPASAEANHARENFREAWMISRRFNLADEAQQTYFRPAVRVRFDSWDDLTPATAPPNTPGQERKLKKYLETQNKNVAEAAASAT